MSSPIYRVAVLPPRRDETAVLRPQVPSERRPRCLQPTRPALVVATAAASCYVVGLPILRPSGPANTAPVDLAAFVLIVAVGTAWISRRVMLRLPYAAPVAVFALAGVLGALAGPVPGLGLLAVMQDVLLLFVCAALTTVARDPTASERLVRLWAISSLCWALALIVGVGVGIPELSGVTEREGARASLTMGDPNMAANYFVTSIFVLLGSGWPTRRLARVVAVAVLLTAMLLTGSNGAVLALAVGALVSVAVGACLRQRRGLLWGVIAAAALIAVVAGAAPLARWQQDVVTYAQGSSIKIVRDSAGRQDQSASTRHMLLDESLQLSKGEPALGSGPGSTKTLLESRQYPYAKEAHDDYLAAITERGALGVLGLTLLFVAVGRRLAWSARDVVSGRRRVHLSMSHTVGCAAAFATSAMFYEVLHFRQLWVFLALLAAHSARGRDGR